MSYTMCSKITFPKTDKRGELVLHIVSSCTITSAWKQLTDTAEVVLPRKIRTFEGKQLQEVFNPGDPIRIALGYNGELAEEFSGYVLSVSRGIPVTIRCEDEMYKLKRKTISYSRKSVTLGQMLKDLIPEYEIQTAYGKTELGAVRYSNMLVSAVLDDIQKKTGLYCFFRNKVLHVGNAYSDKELESVNIHLERNAVSQDLQQSGGDYEVTAIALLEGGKKMEAQAGTKGAETFRITLDSKDDKITAEVLKQTAKRIYENLKKQKYKGGIELFGVPVVRHGMIVELKSEVTPEMDGKYLVEKVEKTFSDNATYRQKVDLGGRVQ